MKKEILFILLICFLMIVPIVSAETINGTLGSGGSTYNNYNVGGIINPQVPNGFHFGRIYNIEYASGLTTIVVFSNASYGEKTGYTSTTITGNTTSFTASIGTTQIGSGTIGYQRIFAGTPPVEQYGGYTYLLFDTWNVTGLTGTQDFNLTWSGLDGMNFSQSGTVFQGDYPVGRFAFHMAGSLMAGDYIEARTTNLLNTYSATKPSGLGITGTVFKGPSYPSQVYITDAITGTKYASDYSITATNFSFNIPAQTIIISVKSSLGDWFNTSQLFNITSLTPVITPVPNTYTFSVNQLALTAGQSNIGTLGGSTNSMTNVTGLRFYSLDVTTPTDVIAFKDTSGYDLDYIYTGGKWWQWSGSGYSIDKGATIPNPATLIYPKDGTFDVGVTVATNIGGIYEVMSSEKVVVGGGSAVSTFIAVDADTGGVILPITIDVKNLNTAMWFNTTNRNPVDIYAFPGNKGNAYLASPAYYPVVMTGISLGDADYRVPMYSLASLKPGETKLDVLVLYGNTGAVAVPGALVAMKNGTKLQSAYTTEAGVASFTVLDGDAIIATATKTGLAKATASETASGVHYVITLRMLAGSAVPTFTVPSTTTTVNIPKTGGNYTGFWGGLANGFQSMGITTDTMGIVFAFLFIFVGAIVGGWSAAPYSPGAPFNAQASALGALFGFILAVAMGFLDFVFVIVIIVILVFGYFFLSRG